ncbi:MAG: hypothetical protein WBB45_18400 [Cyclobacteriaceae bacterium]
MKLPVITCALFFFLASCGTESRHDEAYEQNTETEDVDIASEDFEVSGISFECSEAGSDDTGTPTATLSAVFDGEKVKIADVNNCNDVEKGNYGSYNIDPDAEAATYSFHAGYGQYFYATIENGLGKVYRVQRDEKDTGDFTYQVIGEYGANGYTKRMD